MPKRVRLLAPTLLVIATALLASRAHAEVTEPNGVVVPLNSANGETQLSELFSTRGESIDFIADGSSTPDTFSPLCGFSATFVLKESGSSLGVGWYNADPANATAPTAAQVYTLVPAGSAVGTVVTGSDIRNDPNYAGGSIGFALIRSPLYFTEKRFNPVCSFCSMPGPWALSVSYPSRLSTSAFYVAFEDGNADAFTWSNDGDFNDYVFYFEGLSCVGEGEACTVEGALGECAPGVRECDTGGALVCKAAAQAQDEVCDALDNDCDGSSDEGEDLCDVGEVCSRGQCVPRCGDTEFLCVAAPFTQCEDGVCIEPACAGVTCDAGKACIAGECLAACDGVTCPSGQSCRAGACVDPCAGVACDGERVCSGGACILRCDCAGCGDGLACNTASGLCVDAGCETQTCNAGEVCSGGACVDACAGANCPRGKACDLGMCVAIGADAGVPNAGSGGVSGAGQGGASGTGPSTNLMAGSGGAAGTLSGGTGGSAGSGFFPGRRGETEASGCGCRTLGTRAAGQGGASAFATGFSAAFVILFALRRRRNLAIQTCVPRPFV